MAEQTIPKQVNTFADSVVDAERLGTEQPLSIPEVKEPAGENAISGALADTLKLTEARATEAKAETDTSRAQLQDRISSITGLQQDRIRQEEDAGIPQLSQELAEVTSQIEARELAMRRQIEQIQDTPGMSITQANRLIQHTQRMAAREIADLSIIQSAKGRNLDSLQASIDRRIALELEGIKFQLQFDIMFHEENHEAWTKEEGRAFMLRIEEEKRAINEETRKQEQIGQVAMTAAQYGANATQIGEIFSSGSFEGAMASGSQFLGAGFALQVDSQMFQQEMQLASHALSQASFSLQREGFEFQKESFYAQQRQAEEQRNLELIEIYRQMGMDARNEIKDTDEYQEWRVRVRRSEDVRQAALTHLNVDLENMSHDWGNAAKSDAFVDTVATSLFYAENPTARRPQDMDATEAAFFARQLGNIKKQMGGENITGNLLRQQVERLNSLTQASNTVFDGQMRAISMEFGVNLTAIDGAILSEDKMYLDNLIGGGSNFDLLQLEQQFIHE